MNLYTTYTYEGETLTIKEWADRLGLTERRIRERIEEGKPMTRRMQAGRKRKYTTFMYEGREITRDDILEMCNCSVQKFYKMMKSGKSIEQMIKENQYHDDEPAGLRGYTEGWIACETVAQKFNLDYNQVRWIVRSRKIDYKCFAAHHGKRMAVRTTDINTIVRAVYEMNESRGMKQEGPGYKKDEKKTLAQLKAEHPLVTDERCFVTSWFPKLEFFNVDDYL